MSGIEDKWETGYSYDSYDWYDGSYDDLVKDFATIEISHTLGYYQGDIVYVLSGGDRYGFLVVGYGSCPGCDALQACDSVEAVEYLQNTLRDGIKWFDSFSDLKEYVLHDNRDLEWFPYEAGWDDFVEKVNDYV